MKLKFFRFFDMVEWYGSDFERFVCFYGVIWGVLRYMEFLKDGSDEEIIVNFFELMVFFFNEVRFLLMEEFRNLMIYV